MKPFEVTEAESPNGGPYVALNLSGYLDAHTVNDFESFMDDSIEKGSRNFLLDISDLNYISSAGIGAIMSFTQRLRRAEGELVLLRPSEKVFKILDKLGFTKIFRLVQSPEEAKQLFGE